MIKTKIKKGISVGILGLFLILSFPINSYASEINREGVITLINKERAERGLNTLSLNNRLQTAAQWKADDMIEKDYWEHFHQGKSPWQWMKEAGYDYLDAGENLAIDFNELEPMHQAWMNSLTHRDNIINSKYQEVGIGIAAGDFEGHETIIVVQMFGNPVAPQTAGEESSSTPSANITQPIQKQFLAQADSAVPNVELKENFWQKIISNYKSNFKRGLAYLSSIFLQNNSASANY